MRICIRPQTICSPSSRKTDSSLNGEARMDMCGQNRDTHHPDRWHGHCRRRIRTDVCHPRLGSALIAELLKLKGIRGSLQERGPMSVFIDLKRRRYEAEGDRACCHRHNTRGRTLQQTSSCARQASSSCDLSLRQCPGSRLAIAALWPFAPQTWNVTANVLVGENVLDTTVG
jgi:hypothetical protein